MSLVFGSAQWLAALGEVLASAPVLSGEGQIRLGQLVVGEDGSTRVAYTVELVAGERPRLLGAGVDEAEVTLVESEAAARSLVEGASTAGALLEAGQIKVRGDANALIRAAGLLEQVAKVSGGLVERMTPPQKGLP